MPYKDNQDKKNQDSIYYISNKERATANYQKRVDRNYTFVFEYLLDHPCVDCGETDPIVLEFDHVRGKKTKGIMQLAANSTIAKIKEEIEKCEVVCRNCHSRRNFKTLHKHKRRIINSLLEERRQYDYKAPTRCCF
jgi:5-methylcytosine-specific restriction endonuclease McrA